MRKKLSKARFWIITAMVAGAILATAVSWTTAKSNNSTQPRATEARLLNSNWTPTSDTRWSKAILSISNMSCGGCVENITASLKPLPGIGKISIDVAAGAADIYFNPDKLKAPRQIAAAITAAGYPAKIQGLVAADQVSAEQRRFAQRSATHIASVGELEITRQDFDMELSHARSRYKALYGDAVFSDARGAQLLSRLKAQISARLISNGIKVQEVDRAGYQITPQKAARSLDSYLNQRKITMEELKADLKANGYPLAYFKKKFNQRLRVQSYLEEVVLADCMDDNDRQQRYGNWLSNATALAKVVYYDKSLEALVKSGSGSGCGGTTCSAAGKKN